MLEKVIVDIKGGFGNQLFCYAFGYAISQERESDLWIDTALLDDHKVKDRSTELDKLQLKYDKRLNYPYYPSFLMRKTGMNRLVKRKEIGFRTKIYKEKKIYQYDEGVFQTTGAVYYDGFWQCYRYFDKYRDTLRKMMKPLIEAGEEVRRWNKEIETSESVSLHIRRGDYIGLGIQLSMEYYSKAIESMTKALTGRGISKWDMYVFSDDMRYAKQYFGSMKNGVPTIHFVEYNDPNSVLWDMMLMSKCHHNIVANSSYSWWGAYLNQNEDPIIFCPVVGLWGKEFYPDYWRGILLQ